MNIDLDLTEKKRNHWQTKVYWINRKRPVQVDGIVLKIFLTENHFIELFKKVLTNAEKIVEESEAEKWINECVVGGINKLRLDKQRNMEVNQLDMMQNTSIIYHSESMLEV